MLGGQKKAACFVRRGLHSGTKGRWLREELEAPLWEFILFEMQIPPRAERAGETGVQGSVLQHDGAKEGGGL